MNTKNRAITIFVILFLIFFIPFLLAYIFYHKADKWTVKTVNHGMLIRPPVNVHSLHLKNLQTKSAGRDTLLGKWTMLYILPAPCDDICKHMLYNMRQIRQANGKDVDRIQRAVAIFSMKTDPSLQQQLTIYPEMKQFYIAKQDFQNAMLNVGTTPVAMQQGYLYLVDPLGNIMMGYSVNCNPSDIFQDLQKLLRVSQIG